MENLINYIKPELLVVALILYFIGVLLKKSKLKDNFIPMILGSISIIACCVYLCAFEGFNVMSITSGIVQGVLCAAASTYVNQVIKQMQKLGQIDEDTANKLKR